MRRESNDYKTEFGTALREKDHSLQESHSDQRRLQATLENREIEMRELSGILCQLDCDDY
jgi:hypothetical protein